MKELSFVEAQEIRGGRESSVAEDFCEVRGGGFMDGLLADAWSPSTVGSIDSGDSGSSS